MTHGVTAPTPPTPRRAGLRMAAAGLVAMAAGVVLILFADKTNDGALSYPEIGSRPAMGVQFFAGLPATFGYVLTALGLYRFLTNESPGDEPRGKKAVAGRVALVVLLMLVFFAGAFALTQWMRRR
jgi:hypothetical protein